MNILEAGSNRSKMGTEMSKRSKRTVLTKFIPPTHPASIITSNFGAPHITKLKEKLQENYIAFGMQTSKKKFQRPPDTPNDKAFIIVDDSAGPVMLTDDFLTLNFKRVDYPKANNLDQVIKKFDQYIGIGKNVQQQEEEHEEMNKNFQEQEMGNQQLQKLEKGKGKGSSKSVFGNNNFFNSEKFDKIEKTVQKVEDLQEYYEKGQQKYDSIKKKLNKEKRTSKQSKEKKENMVTKERRRSRQSKQKQKKVKLKSVSKYNDHPEDRKQRRLLFALENQGESEHYLRYVRSLKNTKNQNIIFVNSVEDYMKLSYENGEGQNCLLVGQNIASKKLHKFRNLNQVYVYGEDPKLCFKLIGGNIKHAALKKEQMDQILAKEGFDKQDKCRAILPKRLKGSKLSKDQQKESQRPSLLKKLIGYMKGKPSTQNKSQDPISESSFSESEIQEQNQNLQILSAEPTEKKMTLATGKQKSFHSNPLVKSEFDLMGAAGKYNVCVVPLKTPEQEKEVQKQKQKVLNFESPVMNLNETESVKSDGIKRIKGKGKTKFYPKSGVKFELKNNAPPFENNNCILERTEKEVSSDDEAMYNQQKRLDEIQVGEADMVVEENKQDENWYKVQSRPKEPEVVSYQMQTTPKETDVVSYQMQTSPREIVYEEKKKKEKKEEVEIGTKKSCKSISINPVFSNIDDFIYERKQRKLQSKKVMRKLAPEHNYFEPQKSNITETPTLSKTIKSSPTSQSFKPPFRVLTQQANVPPPTPVPLISYSPIKVYHQQPVVHYQPIRYVSKSNEIDFSNYDRFIENGVVIWRPKQIRYSVTPRVTPSLELPHYSLIKSSPLSPTTEISPKKPMKYSNQNIGIQCDMFSRTKKTTYYQRPISKSYRPRNYSSGYNKQNRSPLPQYRTNQQYYESNPKPKHKLKHKPQSINSLQILESLSSIHKDHLNLTNSHFNLEQQVLENQQTIKSKDYSILYLIFSKNSDEIIKKIYPLCDSLDSIKTYPSNDKLGKMVTQAKDVFDFVLALGVEDKIRDNEIRAQNFYYVVGRGCDVDCEDNCIRIEDVTQIHTKLGRILSSNKRAIPKNRTLKYIYYKDFNKPIRHLTKILHLHYPNAQCRRYFNVRDLPSQMPAEESSCVAILIDEVGFDEMAEYFREQESKMSQKLIKICIPKANQSMKIGKKQDGKKDIIWLTGSELKDAEFLMKRLKRSITEKMM